MPLRKAGGFGTPDRPVYFEEGDVVPWWLEVRWPLNLNLTFAHDVETFYADGYQVIHPVGSSANVIMVADAGHVIPYVFISGAPTEFHFEPRPRRPSIAPSRLLIAA